MHSVTVELGDRSYPIMIAGGLIDQGELVVPYLKQKRVVIVTNDVVGPLYLERFRAGLQAAGVVTSEVILPDGEAHKDWPTLNLIFDGLLSRHADRGTTLVALGGGVIGDITGFAAATYQRGVPFIQIPTTVLSQVDSSVGGKTAINHPLGKNMIGAFHQPRLGIRMTDTPHAPWWIVPSDDKKRARINCISHLLGMIPYKRVPFSKPSLGQRDKRPKGYEPDAGERQVVPDVF